MEDIATLRELLDKALNRISELEEQVARLAQENEDLRRQLAKNSGNSSKPPSSQLVAWVRIWAQSPLSANDYAARLKTARPRRVMRLSDFVAIWFSVSWRFISLAFSLGPMTSLRRPIWASTRALRLYPVADCHAIRPCSAICIM